MCQHSQKNSKSCFLIDILIDKTNFRYLFWSQIGYKAKDGVRFFCTPILVSRPAFLTVCLPAFAGKIQPYHVSCK